MKLITMDMALHPRADIDRLSVSRKVAGRGPASIENCVDVSIRRLADYIKSIKERLITN